MRTILTLLTLATPTYAWEFTPGLPCRLSHETKDARIELTYDPTQPRYSLTITRPAPWPDVPGFAMRFDGSLLIAIGTDRHVLSEDGTALSVTDSGFGNVLDGLQYNSTATAQAGAAEVSFSLAGAAEPVAAFRACEEAGLAS